ncbi:MAG: hypothetical protein KBF59_05515 [Ignavibacterium sp.]|nr:hypothetical protein [Ignavibacterium sp.]
MGYIAGMEAIESAGIDKEDLDYIIVAHNWGDVDKNTMYCNLLPNLASKIKNKLGIKNEDCIAYDILFGCPGWIEAVKQASIYIESGLAKNILIIGTDTVSRVVEKCDINSMLFSDGAGAIVLQENLNNKGIIGIKTYSNCTEEINYLTMDNSFDKEYNGSINYLKMKGKNVFKYGLEMLPKVINKCIENSSVSFEDIKYFLLHQANTKMIELIGQKLMKDHNLSYSEDAIPINIEKMGNNSVATIPTLLYELFHQKLGTRSINDGDIIAMASVGAGMHANCILHRF